VARPSRGCRGRGGWRMWPSGRPVRPAEAGACSPDAALIGDDLAVVRERARVDELHMPAPLGHRLQARRDGVAEAFTRAAAFGIKRHDVLLGLAADREAQAAEFGMPLGDLRYLAGMHEHA